MPDSYTAVRIEDLWRDVSAGIMSAGTAFATFSNAANDTAAALRDLRNEISAYQGTALYATGISTVGWSGITWTSAGWSAGWTTSDPSEWVAPYNPYLDAEYIERIARLDRERAEADARADALLMEYLSLEERETLAEQKCLYVKVHNRTYKLPRHHGGGIDLLGKDGKPKVHYCVSVPGVPAGDDLLARKLMLQMAERHILSKANRTDY